MKVACNEPFNGIMEISCQESDLSPNPQLLGSDRVQFSIQRRNITHFHRRRSIPSPPVRGHCESSVRYWRQAQQRAFWFYGHTRIKQWTWYGESFLCEPPECRITIHKSHVWGYRSTEGPEIWLRKVLVNACRSQKIQLRFWAKTRTCRRLPDKTRT